MSVPLCVICGEPIPAGILEHAAAAGVKPKYDKPTCRRKAKNLRYARNVTQRRRFVSA